MGEWAFWTVFWFYPYFNHDATTLTPTQLYQVLDEELGLFYPDEAMNDLRGLENCYVNYPRRFRQPVIPSYYNEHEKYQVDQEEWDSNRVVVVVDNEELRHVKYFEASSYDILRYACKRHMDAEESLSEMQLDLAVRYNSDEEGIPDHEDNKVRKKGRNCNDDGKEDMRPKWGNQYAAWFLGRPTSKWCRLRGITATRIATDRVSTAVVNLGQANLDFEDFEEPMWGTEEWSPLPKPSSEQLTDKIGELAL